MEGDAEPKSSDAPGAGDASESDADVGAEPAGEAGVGRHAAGVAGYARELHAGSYFAAQPPPAGVACFAPLLGGHTDPHLFAAVSPALRRGARSAATTSAVAALVGAALLVVAVAAGVLPVSQRMAGPVLGRPSDTMVKAQAHCYVPCGGKSGRCDHYCGEGLACCLHGDLGSPECRGVEYWSTTLWHTCVRPGGSRDHDVALPVVDLAAELTRPVERAALAQARAEAPARRAAAPAGYRDSIHDPDVDLAQCTIDSMQAAFSLGAAGTGVSAATRVCRTPWRQSWEGNYGTTQRISQDQNISNPEATCTAATTDLISAFSFAAAFLADAATNCAMGFITKAQCAGDIGYLIASFAEVATSAATMTQTCRDVFRIGGGPPPVDAFDGAYGRRLSEQAASAKDPKGRRLEWSGPIADKIKAAMLEMNETREQELKMEGYKVAGVRMTNQDARNAVDNTYTECALDATESALFSARAGVFIERAQRDCPDGEDSDGCAVDVQYILNAFGFVGAFMAYAVNHCGNFENLNALCGSSVTNLVAALDGIAAAGTDFRRSCELFNPAAPQYEPGAAEASDAAAAAAAEDNLAVADSSFTPQAPPAPTAGAVGSASAPAAPPAYTPVRAPPPPPPVGARRLRSPLGGGEVRTFYVYRAEGPQPAPLSNANAWNLAGVMRLLQHEAASTQPRKHAATTIARYLVRYSPPQALVDAGMAFGVRFAYEGGRCTGPGDCHAAYKEYGHFLGCKKLGDFPPVQSEPRFPDGVSYSLPSAGLCSGAPSGSPGCTHSVERAGSVAMEELEGPQGAARFWTPGESDEANAAKVQAVDEAFRRVVGGDSERPADPACDFDFAAFYRGSLAVV